tara:strand:+ start:365 stop:883 length:519 start_codon:yes stop_codon:yes gene_type:complete
LTEQEKIQMAVFDSGKLDALSYVPTEITFTGDFFVDNNTGSGPCKIRLSWLDGIENNPDVSSIETLRDTDVWETITDVVDHEYLLRELDPWIKEIRSTFLYLWQSGLPKPSSECCETDCYQEEKDIPGQKTFNFNNDGNVTVNLTTCLGRESLDKLNTIASNEEWYRYNGYQ